MEKSVTNSLPKISIVTPSYNQGQFLEETLLSVLDQNYPNLEYFVMDGGSTDNSIEIIQKYAPRLTYWESKPDRGQSHAINKGFKMATGELVAWLNSDDLFTPGALFEVAEIWERDKSFGMIHGISEIVDEKGNSTGKERGSPIDFMESLLTSDNPVAQPSTFISRLAMEDVGYLDEKLHMSMDWDLWLQIASKYDTRFVSTILSKSRYWSLTKTSTQVEISARDHVFIVKKIVKNKSIPLQKTEVNKALAAAFGLLALYNYRSNKRYQAKVSLIRSLLYNPRSKGGKAKKIRKKILPRFYTINQKISSMKRRLTMKKYSNH